MDEFVEIVHNGESVSLSTFVEANLIKLDATFTINDLFIYQYNDARILISYLPEEKAQFNDRASQTLIKSGTLIRIPVDRIDKEVIAVESSVLVPNDNYRAYLSEQIKSIISDVKYKPVNLDSVDSSESKTYRVYNAFTIWIWAKALGDDVLDGRLIDVTPFVSSVSITTAENGGNFQISICPVLGECIEEQRTISQNRELLGNAGFEETLKQSKWRINKGSAIEYAYNGRKNIVVRDSIYRKNKGIVDRKEVLFHNLIQSNDVVFIQLEELEIEEGKRDFHRVELGIENLLISNDKLPGRYFDMIGLIDSNTLSSSPATAEISVSLSGRDLMKLLIEDGEYFFTADFAGKSAGIAVDSTGLLNSGNNDSNKPLARLIDANLNFFNAYVDRTIEYSLKFILNMLSNVEICNNNLFNFYQDKVKRYDYSASTNKSGSLQKIDVAGIWQIIKLVIDPEISNRRLVDSSIVSDQGSLLNFIKGKVIHAPFTEFFGDTYGDKYHLIARKPPFSKESYIDNKKYAIDIDPSVVISESLGWDDSEVFSWYRIIPKGNFFGDDQSTALNYFPAIFFEDYARIWGSRPLIQVSNYIDYNGIKDRRGTINIDTLTQQSLQDLAYLIETNAYRPFTRKGTISLGIGDRRIKRGQCIRYFGEIFHVDSITNSRSVDIGSTDSSSIISVSRGMVEKYMENTDFNYFNIIDLDRDKFGKSKSPNFKVNRDVFQFFIKRLQNKR